MTGHASQGDSLQIIASLLTYMMVMDRFLIYGILVAALCSIQQVCHVKPHANGNVSLHVVRDLSNIIKIDDAIGVTPPMKRAGKSMGARSKNMLRRNITVDNAQGNHVLIQRKEVLTGRSTIR